MKEIDLKMYNTDFVKDCQLAVSKQVINRDTLSFEELFNLKYPVEVKETPSAMSFWYKFTIYAKTKKDFTMSVWNGKYPVDQNINKHICEAGNKVRVWMVSRLGDIGITDNLDNPNGYDCRGVKIDDLYDWEIIKN